MLLDAIPIKDGLQPLIDDMKKLWSGVMTYNISRKRNFMMRAVLMWTINDFPIYGCKQIARPSTKMGWNACIPNLCRVGALFSNTGCPCITS